NEITAVSTAKTGVKLCGEGGREKRPFSLSTPLMITFLVGLEAHPLTPSFPKNLLAQNQSK
ncbi:MAG: hypothetical protein KC423_23180, partial [Anaerolineales bacterium]|nr:hypothetical protein [Anaerolineales bacterium]